MAFPGISVFFRAVYAAKARRRKGAQSSFEPPRHEGQEWHRGLPLFGFDFGHLPS